MASSASPVRKVSSDPPANGCVPADEFPWAPVALGLRPNIPAAFRPQDDEKRRDTTSSGEQAKPQVDGPFRVGLQVSRIPCRQLLPLVSRVRILPGPPTKQVDACFVSAGPIPTTSGPRSGRIQAAREARNVSAGRSAKRSSIRPCWTGAAGPRPPGLQTCAQARCEEERHNGVFSRPTDRPATPPPGCGAKPG